MDYQSEQLGPQRFQQMCQALLAKDHPDLQCYPVLQADGGRDATLCVGQGRDRKLVVFQIKYSEQPDIKPGQWLNTVRRELPKVKELVKQGASQYYILTNVRGTGYLQSGSIDRTQALLAELGIPALCLWRDDLSRRIDAAWDIKWSYPEIMNGPDILRFIIEQGFSVDQQQRLSAIRAYVREQYERDRDIRFRQIDLKTDLIDLFVDVPIASLQDVDRGYHVPPNVWRLSIGTSGGPHFDVDDVLLEHGDEPGAARILLDPDFGKMVSRVIIEGAPGQGKSTLVQFVCQVYRMFLLDEATDIARLPKHFHVLSRHLPFRVDLRDFASWLEGKDPYGGEGGSQSSPQGPRTLEAFLAYQVNYFSGGIAFTVSDLLAVSRISSMLVVLDGLDEVPDVGQRCEIVDKIVSGANRLDENAADLQVIVTTRPTAFTNVPSFPKSQFAVYSLSSLTQDLIADFARRWCRAKGLDKPKSQEDQRILKEKMGFPHLRDLARNPMQLAILLTLIHTQGPSLPDKRTALYDNYVALFFNREVEKSEVVRQHREILIAIHQYLGWVFHSRAETVGNSGRYQKSERSCWIS